LLSVGIASWATGADLLASGYPERCISPMTGTSQIRRPGAGRVWVYILRTASPAAGSSESDMPVAETEIYDLR